MSGEGSRHRANLDGGLPGAWSWQDPKQQDFLIPRGAIRLSLAVRLSLCLGAFVVWCLLFMTSRQVSPAVHQDRNPDLTGHMC